MTPKEAKSLKVGDRVQIWAESPDACTGTVIETGYNAVKFEWDDAQISALHLNDMADVARYYGKDRFFPWPKEKGERPCL